MKALQIIVALCITSSFSLNAMGEQYMGLEKYHDRYANRRSGIYTYSRPSWFFSSWLFEKKNTENCKILNAYILLNRRPNESVEQQLEFYEQNLETITEKLKYFPTNSYYFEKEQLKQKQTFLQAIIPQIKQANLSGKVQDPEIQQHVTKAVHNIIDYNGTQDYRYEFDDLKFAVKNAHSCEFNCKL